MIKSPIGLQELRRRIYRKAKSDKTHRFWALISEIENRFLDTFARAIDYLAGNARRAHPKRDRQRGRLQFGLEPIFANP